MNKFKVYEINEISETVVDGHNGYYVHCEIDDNKNDVSGGEAISLSIIEVPNLVNEYEIEWGIFKVKKYLKAEVIKHLNTYINGLEAKNWNELKFEIEKNFIWI